MGAGVLYPKTVSYPALELGLASPNDRSAPPIAINSVNWVSAAGQQRPLYTAPPKWMLLRVMNDGTWAVVTTGPVIPDYRSAAESAFSPWDLSAFNVTGHSTLLAHSSGGTTMNPPPMVAQMGDFVLWTKPFVSVSGGAPVFEANLTNGSRRSVLVAVPNGDVVDGLVTTSTGANGWPTPVITAGPPGRDGKVFCPGKAALPSSLGALMGLPDGRILLAGREALYASQACESWSKLASLDGIPSRTWTGPGSITWVNEDVGKVREVLLLGPAGDPKALYRAPSGVQVSGDAQGLAWYDVARAAR
jgi:hypothetical protein